MESFGEGSVSFDVISNPVASINFAAFSRISRPARAFFCIFPGDLRIDFFGLYKHSPSRAKIAADHPSARLSNDIETKPGLSLMHLVLDNLYCQTPSSSTSSGRSSQLSAQ